MTSVLVVGSGGREHALAWKLAQSHQVNRVIVAPGNAGMPMEWERWPVLFSEGRKAFEELADRAKQQGVALAVVGPDNLLADGIVDVFTAKGIPTFGPTAAAAKIESSKAFAKEIMKAAGVPTAEYWIAHSEEEARKILQSVSWSQGQGWVVKADGLALGKGVRVCETQAEALEAVSDLSKISGKLVIEELLRGEESSWMAFCDGERCSLLEPARDYKRLLDSDHGPNTGGMGAFSPVPGIPAGFAEEIRERVFLPTLREMKHRGTEFRGLLYAGLMIDPESGKFQVLEFNSRFGDPETQVLLPRMDDDLFIWCERVACRNLKDLPDFVPFKKDPAVYVVAASRGYPEQPETGKRIQFEENLDCLEPVSRVPLYFFAGVRDNGQDVGEAETGREKEKRSGKLLTGGGRVLGSLGIRSTLELARESAYGNLKKVHFDGMQFRSDIGRLR